MSTTRNARSHQPQAEARPSKTKIADIGALSPSEMLQQVIGLLEPLIEFHKADKEMTMDDVRMYWDIRAIRGADKPICHLQGSSTFNKMLAPNMVALAPFRFRQEIDDKILMPLTAVIQNELERLVAEGLAEDEEAVGPGGLC